MRLAVALAGIDHDAFSRGAVLVAEAGWHPSRVLRGDVSLLGAASAVLSPRASVRFHLGTTEVGARIVTAGGPLFPGETKAARIVLDAPLVSRAGDRFVIRGGSPMGTLGGGTVIDPHPVHRRARPWSAPHDSAADRLALCLAEAGGDGLAVDDLPVRIGASPPAVRALIDAGSSSVVRIGGRIFPLARRTEIVAAMVRMLDDHHARHPLDPGAVLQTLRAQLPGRPELVDDAIRLAVDRGEVSVDAGVVRRASWVPRLSEEQVSLKGRLLDALRAAGAEPPTLAELAATHGNDVASLMRILERERLVVPVEADRLYASDALDALVGRLRAGMMPGREYSPSELRDVIGLSRKYLIPFLEFCDRRGVTERRPTGRVLHGT